MATPAFIFQNAELVRTITSKAIPGNQANLFDIITVSMSLVEQIKDKTLAGEDKKDMAKDFLVPVIDFLVSINKLSLVEGEAIKTNLKQQSDTIDLFIDTAAYLTNNPDLINMPKHVTKACCAVL